MRFYPTLITIILSTQTTPTENRWFHPKENILAILKEEDCLLICTLCMSPDGRDSFKKDELITRDDIERDDDRPFRDLCGASLK